LKPINIKFVRYDEEKETFNILDQDAVTSYTVESSNLSLFATSSLPFFDDDQVRNREYTAVETFVEV
jgi:hypothetical protein